MKKIDYLLIYINNGLNSFKKYFIKSKQIFKYKTRIKDIQTVYERYGKIKDIRIKHRKAYVKYDNNESAEEAY